MNHSVAVFLTIMLICAFFLIGFWAFIDAHKAKYINSLN